MAHHKSAIKRIRRNDRASERNSQYLSSVRSAVKKFRLAVAGLQNGTVEKSTLTPLFVSAQSLLAKAANKGVIHRNNAVRKIGRLSKLLKSVEESVAGTSTASKGPKTAAKKTSTKRKKTAAKKTSSAKKKK